MAKCPVHGCREEISDDRLMCYRHWKLVEPGARETLWREWNNGRGALSDEYRIACRVAAIEVAKVERGR